MCSWWRNKILHEMSVSYRITFIEQRLLHKCASLLPYGRIWQCMTVGSVRLPLCLSSLSEKARHLIHYPKISGKFFPQVISLDIFHFVLLIKCHFMFHSIHISFHFSICENPQCAPWNKLGLFVSEADIISNLLQPRNPQNSST